MLQHLGTQAYPVPPGEEGHFTFPVHDQHQGQVHRSRHVQFPRQTGKQFPVRVAIPGQVGRERPEILRAEFLPVGRILEEETESDDDSDCEYVSDSDSISISLCVSDVSDDDGEYSSLLEYSFVGNVGISDSLELY